MMSPCGCDDAGCDSGNELLPIEEALTLLLKKATPITATEVLNILDAHGRILAEDLSSRINVPPADNSAMDGYAIRSQDLKDAEPVLLPVSQRIPAGKMGASLRPGTAARIFTGAPIPAGADTVIMQEVCTPENNGVWITGPVRAGQNIRNAGEDIRTGDKILDTGTRLKPQDIGLAASVGIRTVKVYKRLRVGIFFTGDELREPGETLDPGQIYNSNRHTMRGLLENLNCDLVDLGTVQDTLKATQGAMLQAAHQADLIMTSGGVSVGEEDYIRLALEELGQLDMWRINIKPGKPLAFGKIDNTPFIGMPGNPVSVFVTFCIFARPFILKSQGANEGEIKTSSFMVPAAFEWPRAGSRHEYVRVRHENGALQLYPNQSSGVLTSTSWANGLAIIPAHKTIKPLELLEFIPYSELSVY